MKISIKGKGAVGIAIAYFALRGKISVPLEPCVYNILFDNENNIYRIKVISCSHKTCYGTYSASIRTIGGNFPRQTAKAFDNTSCDFVFIVTDQLDMYNIPSEEINSKMQISLRLYEKYKVSFPASGVSFRNY